MIKTYHMVGFFAMSPTHIRLALKEGRPSYSKVEYACFDRPGLDPAGIPSYIGTMEDEQDKTRSDMGWGIPASVLLHAVLAFVLFFHLPLDISEPPAEESVKVEIVAPPEPEEKAEEQKPPEAEETKEEGAPPAAEPPPQEEAKQKPSAPEPEQEAAKTPEPPPPSHQAEAKEPPAGGEGKPQPAPVLRPVFEFGEKDAGPRKSETGDASRQTAAETTLDDQTVDMPKPAADAPAVAEAPLTDPEAPVGSAPPVNPVPEDINLPEIDMAAANSRRDGPLSGPAADDAANMDIVAAAPSAPPKTEPAEVPLLEKPVALTEAKTLFSREMTDDPIATTAMAGIPRGTRAGELCSTELSAQLRHSSYRPNYVPVPRLPSGTVLNVKSAGFRDRGQWYDLSFRCEVNEDATKVLSFAFHVGAPVPRSEWRRRGFPEQ